VSAGYFQLFSSLRQGRNQEIGVFLCRPTPRLPDCALHEMDVDDHGLPVLLEMEPVEGFTIQYGDGSHYKGKQPGKAYNLADRRIVFLKLHASSSLASGEYKLKGTLVYKISGGAASSETSRVPVEIRVRVVDHNARVTRLEWPYGSHPREALKNALIGFVAVPFWTGYLLYAGAYCALSDCK
jgi:hypothetical protein